jgi:hypothetical protein
MSSPSLPDRADYILSIDALSRLSCVTVILEASGWHSQITARFLRILQHDRIEISRSIESDSLSLLELSPDLFANLTLPRRNVARFETGQKEIRRPSASLLTTADSVAPQESRSQVINEKIIPAFRSLTANSDYCFEHDSQPTSNFPVSGNLRIFLLCNLFTI